MDNNFEYLYTRFVALRKCETFCIACLAIAGVISIARKIASDAYQLGRATREREIKKEYKQYMKSQKKASP